MSSIGEFREGEIDGKPFHIFTFLSQTDIPTSSSSSSGEVATESGGNNDLPLEPLFLCPRLRRRAQELNLEKDLVLTIQPCDISPYFPNIRSGDRRVRYLLDSDKKDYYYECKLPVSPLSWCNNKEPNFDEFHCGACYSIDYSTSYYFCVNCDEKFHKECVESPLSLKHPFYSSPFQLSYVSTSTSISKSLSETCFRCDKYVIYLAYHLPTYNVVMHLVCAMKPIPIAIVIDHPKRHPHPLSLFPKQASLACDVCGLIKGAIPTYICVRCVYVVHQDCIYFPKVIKMSRHHHRISFTSSLPSSGKFSCGVCRQKVDNDCGAYGCNKCDDYFVHSRCALRKDLWDGEDLEGVPEEPEEVVDPFKRITDGIILHFSHGHQLELKVSRVYDANKLCQACTLPVYEGCYYSCLDHCDFILHESCANAPLKKFHALHRHPLMLKVTSNQDGEAHTYYCDVCRLVSCGFVYECLVEGCELQLDVRCASVSEPFEYQGHEHPLFLALNPEEEKSAICQICREGGDSCDSYWRRRRKLNCIECDYIICFICATLPYKARYRHDKHLLTFRKGKEASDDQSDWCEVCETNVVYSREGGYYSCHDCCTTLHVHCLLGKTPYLKPGRFASYSSVQKDSETGELYRIYTFTHTLWNNSMTRPFCWCCKHRCPDKIVFERFDNTFCSLECSRKLRMSSSGAWPYSPSLLH